MLREIQNIYKNDPSARGLEVLLYPGLYAVLVHKYFSTWLYKYRLKFLARFFSQLLRLFTGIEIHPGAKIGRGLFIDHGMGVVIGETAEVGDDCIFFQGVSLGSTGKDKGKRHPTIGNRVLIGAQSILLGPISVGDDSKIGAGTVVVGTDIPANVTVVGNPAKIVRMNGERINKDL